MKRVTPECWFCGRTAHHRGHDRAIGFHKNVDTGLTRWVVVIRTRWQSDVVLVPRCARCHTGHMIEQLALVLAIAAVIAYAASGQLDHLLVITSGEKSGAAIWAAVALLPAAAWIAIRQAWLPFGRLAPRRLRYARQHPDVVRHREEGWRFRPGPFPYWGFPEGTVPLPPSHRIGGVVLTVLAAASFVATIVIYFRGSSELAGGFLAATAGLGFLATKVNPEA
ncbi:hypothetical protein AB0E59_20685 [Lentzea sp. NPDC034063]|uniref:hypothetical protein n=1 Tax=unclassified Lentzea TaxID=2643253 RepID=UPI0033CDBD99